MISDDSSSDSETGRFKSSDTKRRDEPRRNTNQRESLQSSGRSKPSDNARFARNFDRRRDERDRYEKPREGHSHRPSRPSPVRERRRYSRERSNDRRRRSHERSRPMPTEPRAHDRERSFGQRPKDSISSSKDGKRHSPIKLNKPSEPRRDFRDEIKRNIVPSTSKEEPSHKYDRARSRTRSSSPEIKSKRSIIVQKPISAEPPNRKTSPITIDKQPASDLSDEPVQAGSYYSMIPAVVKEKEKSAEKEKGKEVSEESSEIDSSDDERLRAKLLNLEKEISKTRKKKHKKKHKKKSSKPKKEEDRDKSTSVEVSSTTDIQEVKTDEPKDVEIVEVTSTQKSNQKESSEEGEISSGDDSQAVEYDSTDLRHKLKRAPAERSRSPDLRERLSARGDVCGPALPPHLDKRRRASESPGHEGPALPPHLQRKDRNIGPSIPSEMRKVLADREVVKYESSDEDCGIGPLPASAQDKWTEAHKKLEERALDIKIKDLDGHSMQRSDVKSREKWMLELPEGKAKIIGLEARSFRAKAGPDMSDRSSWTDTPEHKARKAAGLAPEEDSAEALRREAHDKYVEKRDHEQEREARKHKKKHKRDESLLQMHEKKLKKKKKKEERDSDGRKERRPFSRDVDLQVNRFDEAQKQSVVKKAQHLDSRFSRGEAKYL